MVIRLSYYFRSHFYSTGYNNICSRATATKRWQHGGKTGFFALFARKEFVRKNLAKAVMNFGL